MCNPASCFNPSAIPPHTHTHTANCVFQTLWKMTGNGFIPLPPCVDPAVHFTSIYSSPGLRPKRERKVKMAVKHSWLLWLQKNLGGGKLAVVCISRARGCGAGFALAFKTCAFSSKLSNQVQGWARKAKERIFSVSDEWLKTPESYKISKEQY